MASLIDLFNPSFLIFLGVLLLAICLIVVYFESKMREQNHKISSMLSLVSSLAEELHGVKFGLTQLSMRGGDPSYTAYQTKHLEENKNNVLGKKLIDVSDDEAEDLENSESETHEDSDSDSGSDSDSDSEVDLASNLYSELDVLDDNYVERNDTNVEDSNEVKVLKLNIGSSGIEDDNDDYNDNDNDNLECEEFNVADDYNDHTSVSESVGSKGSQKSFIHSRIESAKTTIVFSLENLPILNRLNEKSFENNVEEENKTDSHITSQPEFKTISINLEEPSDSLDYKKLPLTKLKSIVTEKGLVADSTKLKKHELLKLLGVE